MPIDLQPRKPDGAKPARDPESRRLLYAVHDAFDAGMYLVSGAAMFVLFTTAPLFVDELTLGDVEPFRALSLGAMLVGCTILNGRRNT